MFNAALACMLSLSLTSPVTMVNQNGVTDLNRTQRQALIEAKKDSNELAWRLFRRTENGRPRSVILLGEVHLAKAEDIDSAQPVTDAFTNIATENGRNTDEPSPGYKVMPIASLMMTPKMVLLVLLSGRSFNSPMDYARPTEPGGTTESAQDIRFKRFIRNAEKLHVPSWTEEVSLLFMGGRDLMAVLGLGALGLMLLRTAFRGNFGHQFEKFGRVLIVYVAVVSSGVAFNTIAGDPILRNRDISMARYIDEFVKDRSVDGPLLVIVGEAHLKNMGKFLTEDYEFRELPIDDTLDARPVRRGLPAPRPL